MLDRAGAQQHLPVVLAGLQGEHRRHQEGIGTLAGQVLEQFGKAQVVADRAAEAEPAGLEGRQLRARREPLALASRPRLGLAHTLFELTPLSRERFSFGLAATPQVNSVFVHLPADAIAPLQAWSFFWEWDLSQSLVRWMTSYATTADDVERFAHGVEVLLAGR